ncbi:fasciclin domain-containing protein [Pedobacter miscanthi]|nr:fasciclin domain-containing protein [Pedobacter miscanthi]
MIKNIKNIPSAFLGLMLIFSVLSCKDNKWDMYEKKPEYLKEGSIFNLLSQKPEFSEFMGLVRKTGYDSVLRRTDLFTVLAVRNGAFGSIDTGSNTPELKKLIGMHILQSAIQQENMDGSRYVAVNGKHINFSKNTTAITANGIALEADKFKAVNGVVYILGGVIRPTKTLREVITSNSDFSIFDAYISSSYISTVDIPKNVITGYNANNQPVYQLPIIYKIASTYMDTVRLDDEKTVSTLFIPTNQVIKDVLSRLLTARANQNGLIVPKVYNTRRDTTIGYFFIPKNVKYAGDTAILMDYLFKNIITRSKAPILANGNNSFPNVTGGQFSIGSVQVGSITGAVASNGIYYTLNSITLPEKVYRKTFIFDPNLQHPTDPNQIVVNPNMTFTMGASPTTTAVPVGNATSGFPRHERGRQFNFTNVGGRIDFTLPLLTKGSYRVILQQVPLVTGTYLNASFGNVQLKQMINASTQFTLGGDPINHPFADVELGNITQPADGAATITLKCAGTGPLGNANFGLIMCNIKFVPI